MKLTRADFKDALLDARRNLAHEMRDAAIERREFGRPLEITQDNIIIESAKVVALRYYLKNTKGAK